MKLHVIDCGDPSVGIFQQEFEVDCPFALDDGTNINEHYYFKQEIEKLFSEYAEGRLILKYDYEIEREEKLYEQLEG